MKLPSFFKKKIIYGYSKDCTIKEGRALLYYKNDPFFNKSLVKKYTHTNNWEVTEIVRILNKLGYVVDLVDRDVSLGDIDRIEDDYDIFVGLGAGNSGKYFPDIAKKLTRALKIFYACGPEPEESNNLIYERYSFFNERHPQKKVIVRRLIDRVDISQAMTYTDAIFCIGNDFCIDTYCKHQKSIYRIYPSTSPKIFSTTSQLINKDKKNFLYFGGNGNIVKGLDLLIETFSELKGVHLYVCAPENEEDFNNVYAERIMKSKNIHMLGFVEVGREVFNDVTSKCGFVILPSCSEGTATSVVTCMRRGLIPIVTKEAGVDLKNFGFLIDSIKKENLRKLIINASQINDDDFLRRSVDTYIESGKYTQANFSLSFESALVDSILRHEGLK